MRFLIGNKNDIFTEYTPLAGATLVWNTDGTLDSGLVRIVTETAEPFSPTDIARLTFPNYETIDMLVGSDTVSPWAKAAGKYVHDLSIIELTKILEKFVINNICLTNTDITTAVQLSRATNNINIQINAKEGTRYRISFAGAQEKFTGKAEELIMSNATAREVYDEILSAYDCRVEVKSISNANGIVCGYVDLNETTDKTDKTDRIGTYYENNIDDYNGKVVSNVSNATPQTLLTFRDTFKAKYGVTTASTNDRVIAFPFSPEYVTDFKLRFNMNVTVNTDGGIAQGAVPQVIDISGIDIPVIASSDGSTSYDYFVDKEFFDTLSTSAQNEQNQNNTLYYVRGQAEADVSRTYKFLLTTTTVFSEMSLKVLDRYFKAHSEIFTRFPYRNIDTDKDKFTVDKAFFTITYAPLIDTLVESTKNIDSDEGLLSVIDGQGGNVIDLTRYGRNLLGKAKRIGNDELIIDCNEKAFTSVLQPLDKIGDYVVYKTELQVMTKVKPSESDDVNWYKARYYLTKNYNSISSKVSLAREKRIYNIPLTGYNTIIPLREKVYFGYTNQERVYADDENLKKTITHYMIETLTNEVEHKPIDSLKITTNNTTGIQLRTFVLPAVGFGAGNTLNLIAKFYDNYSAGLSLDLTSNIFNWIGGKKVAYNPYVNDNGEVSRFQAIQFGYSTNFSGDYAKVRPIVGNGETFFTVNSDEASYNKDRAESISIQKIYEFTEKNLISGKNKVRIGTALLAKNNAINANIPVLMLYKDCPDKYINSDTQQYYGEGTYVGYVKDTLTYGLKYEAVTGGYTAKRWITPKTENTTYNNIVIADTFGRIYLAASVIKSKGTSDFVPCITFWDEQILQLDE